MPYKNPICGIYKIYFTGDSKVYIGLSNNILQRKAHHIRELKCQCHRNDYLQKAFNKYSIDSFVFEILETCDCGSLKDRELFYIKQYKSDNRDFGFNLTVGGEITIVAQETREKLRRANIGKSPSAETREKIRKANLGKKLPQEQIDKLSASLRGRKLWNEEQKDAISKRMKGNQHGKGKPASEERKIKIGKANMGNKAFLGRHHKEETKKMMSEKFKGRKMWDEEARKKISQRNKGYKHTDESKNKIADANRSRTYKPHTEETKQRLRKLRLGTKLPQEQIDKIKSRYKDPLYKEQHRQKILSGLQKKKEAKDG